MFAFPRSVSGKKLLVDLRLAFRSETQTQSNLDEIVRAALFITVEFTSRTDLLSAGLLFRGN